MEHPENICSSPIQRKKCTALNYIAQTLPTLKFGNEMALNNPESVATFAKSKMTNLFSEESFMVIFLNTKLALLGAKMHGSGSIDSTAVDVRGIVKSGILCDASAIALVHNHPSGNPSPSTEDNNLTKRIYETCKLFKRITIRIGKKTAFYVKKCSAIIHLKINQKVGKGSKVFPRNTL